MAKLKLQLLGDLKVIRGDSVLALPPSKKTRALLAYLALSTHPHRRERLCELLWETPDDPRGSLRWSLSKLRRLVDDDQHTRIIADRSQVAFASDDVEIDSVTLLALSNADLQSLPLAALEQAVKAYRGNFLEGLELPNFYDFYSWCISEREAAVRAQVVLLESLTTRLQAQPERCLDYRRQLVSIAPYDEAARVALIGLLKQLGRNQDAEQQYAMGQRMLDEAGAPDSGALFQAWRGSLGRVRAETRIETSAHARPTHHAPNPQPVDSGLGELLGRSEELAWLGAALTDTQQRGDACMRLLLGEPGIGKSTLLDHFAVMAQRAGAYLLRADAFEAEQIRPFALWSDALSAAPALAAGDLFSGDERVEREQLFTSLGHMIGELASQQTLVILFDDMQWCDESSAAVLHYLLRSNRQLPLLIAASARHGELRDNGPVMQTLSGLRHDQLLQELPLQTLNHDALISLIIQQAPDADCQRLSEECGGNPLLAIELARAELDGGKGSSLTDMINGRLARLDIRVVEALRWAAVLTPAIDVNMLEQLSALERRQLDQAMDIGEQQGILRAGDRGFRFTHELVARSIYANISPTRRQTMHRRAAEVLEVATSQDLKLAAELARHAAQSGDPALAARAMVLAGKLCLRFYANEEALNLARKGLHFAEKLSDAERICLTLELSEVQLMAAPLDDWQSSANVYVDLAEQALDYGALRYARLGYQMASYVKWQHGHWRDAQQAIMQAERITRSASDEEHINGIAEAAKCLAMLERDLSQADAMLMEAQALAERKQVHASAIPAARGMLRYFEGRFTDAEELLLDARNRYKSAGDRINEYQANEYLVMVAIEQGDYPSALARCQPLQRIGDKLREGSEGPCARGLEALCQYADDDNPQALDQQLSALRIADAKQRLAYILNRAALIECERGQAALAAQHATEALDCARSLSRASEMLMARVTLARLCERDGNIEALHQHLAELAELQQLTGARWAHHHAEALLKAAAS